MTEMIERVAAAIYVKRNGAGAKPFRAQPLSHRHAYFADARAAIEAMREPGMNMISAGEDALEEYTESDWDSGPDGESHNTYTYMRSGHMRAAFTAMIDAALGEEQ